MVCSLCSRFIFGAFKEVVGHFFLHTVIWQTCKIMISDFDGSEAFGQFFMKES